MRAVVPWLVLLMAVSSARGDDKSAEFEEHTFAWHGGAKMPYRLLKPEKVEAGKKYPLVLILHGWGERGTDNKKQLKDFGPAFLKPGVRKRFPCFVLLPQANGSWVEHPVFDKPIRLTKTPTANLVMAHEIVKAVVKKHPVDADRLYLMGYSNGACGVWELLEREPHALGGGRAHGRRGRPVACRRGQERRDLGLPRRKGPDDPARSDARAGGRPAGRPRPSDVHDLPRRRPLSRQEWPPRPEPLALDVRPAPGEARSAVRESRQADRQAADEPGKK